MPLFCKRVGEDGVQCQGNIQLQCVSSDILPIYENVQKADVQHLWCIYSGCVCGETFAVKEGWYIG